MAAVFIVNSSIFTLSFAFFVTQTCAKHEISAVARSWICIGRAEIMSWNAWKRLFLDIWKCCKSTVRAAGFCLIPLSYTVLFRLLFCLFLLFFSLFLFSIPSIWRWGLRVKNCLGVFFMLGFMVLLTLFHPLQMLPKMLFRLLNRAFIKAMEDIQGVGFSLSDSFWNRLSRFRFRPPAAADLRA